MMNYLKYSFFIVGIVLSFFVVSSVASAGGSCFATGPTTASFQLTGCPNPGHGALYFADTPTSFDGRYWMGYTVNSSYTYCNRPSSLSGLSPGRFYNFAGFDSNNIRHGLCSFSTPAIAPPPPPPGTVRVMPNITSTAGWLWRIDGPATRQYGLGPVTLNNRRTGTYVVTWYDYTGYTKTVSSQSLTLTSRGTITFSNTYTRVSITAPTLTFLAASSITASSAILGANITSNGGAPITARGTCWGLSFTTVINCAPAGGTALGVFSHLRTGIPSATRIYHNGYATNRVGTAYSPIVVYTSGGNPVITISKIGTGSGTITSSPVGVNCGASCSAPFAYGSYVTFTATPAPGSIFDGWYQDSAGTTFLGFYDRSGALIGTNCNTGTTCRYGGVGLSITFYPKFTAIGVTSGTLNASNCLISAGSSTCTSNVSWSITNPVAPNSVRQNGVSFFTASSGSALRTISYSGPNTFTLYSNNGATLLATISPTASCTTGTSWNGSVCAVIPAFTCTGATPTNATIYGGDEAGLSVNTPKSYSITDTAPKCQFSCNSGTSWNGTSCVASSCGDNICNGIETLLTCPRDCKTKVIQF